MTLHNVMRTKSSKYKCKYRENVMLLIQQIKFTGTSLCFNYSRKALFSLNDRLVQKPKLLKKMPRCTAEHNEEILLQGVIHLSVKNTGILAGIMGNYRPPIIFLAFSHLKKNCIHKKNIYFTVSCYFNSTVIWYQAVEALWSLVNCKIKVHEDKRSHF